MLWRGAATDRAWFGNQRQIELVGISLLGLAAKVGLLEGGPQLLKSFDPLSPPESLCCIYLIAFGLLVLTA